MAAPRYWKASGTLNGATAVALKAASTGRTHVVTKVVVQITTHANAKLVKVQDGAGTPVVLFTHHDLTKAAGVPDMVEVNFGTPRQGGVPGTISTAINCVSEASGVAGIVFVEGYTI